MRAQNQMVRLDSTWWFFDFLRRMIKILPAERLKAAQNLPKRAKTSRNRFKERPKA